MLLVDKELLNNFNSYECKQKIIDYYNKNLIMFIDDDKIEISKKLLAQLLRDSYKLSCLEAAGVDNWENYSEALSSRELFTENYWDYINKSDSEIIKEYGFKE